MATGMQAEGIRWAGRSALAVAAAFALFAVPTFVSAAAFNEELARVDRALRANPTKLPPQTLESCFNRRKSAVELYRTGHTARAQRRLRYCINLLKIPDAKPARADAGAAAAPSMEEVRARAAAEVGRALDLTPNIENGLAIYRNCAECHMPEGWGLSSGLVPQLAGQHRTVVIKQLADIRAGNRDNPLMVPYASVESIGGAQAVADVAGYIDTLEISIDSGKGPGDDLARGAALYRENCADCHGPRGEGDAERYIPRIQAQHYNYLVRQFEWIRDGRRRNANPKMVEQIQDFDERETQAVLDYVSRLDPPPEFQAPPGWHNPDFAD